MSGASSSSAAPCALPEIDDIIAGLFSVDDNATDNSTFYYEDSDSSRRLQSMAPTDADTCPQSHAKKGDKCQAPHKQAAYTGPYQIAWSCTHCCGLEATYINILAAWKRTFGKSYPAPCKGRGRRVPQSCRNYRVRMGKAAINKARAAANNCLRPQIVVCNNYCGAFGGVGL